MKKVDAMWRSYAEQVIPPTAGTVQRMESRRAFYAGAQAFMGILLGLLEPGTEPTDKDLVLMDNLANELNQFSIDVKEGRA